MSKQVYSWHVLVLMTPRHGNKILLGQRTQCRAVLTVECIAWHVEDGISVSTTLWMDSNYRIFTDYWTNSTIIIPISYKFTSIRKIIQE